MKMVMKVIEQAKRDGQTSLDLSEHQLTTFPLQITELENLRELFIYGNKLTSLPPEISKLKNLTGLYINRNNLTSLPYEISLLKNLKKLDIADNKLTELPREILELNLDIEWENRYRNNIVYLKGNPFDYPPIEIIKMGKGAVLDYLRSLKGEKQEINEVKVLFVGQGGSGKTSLMKRLVGENFNDKEPQTHGINIKKWALKKDEKEIKVNFWDFGGQEIMHSTHQFFLSRRSLYILVLDARREEMAEYWLQHIHSFGGDSPVLIALNKIDENPSFDVNRKFLQEKYPFIKGFYRISCKKFRGIRNFGDKLREELARVEHVKIKWSENWFNVKTKLENINCAFITYEEFQKICIEENIMDESSQNTLIDFLNDLGVVVHFKDTLLLDTHVIEPRWITEAVYKIINSEELDKSGGILKFSFLKEILKKKEKDDFFYPPSQYNFIINLMKKFELCYEINTETVLLADRLNIQEPYFDFKHKKALRFIIEYDFLPRAIMPRFIVKMHEDIKDNLQWRTGVVLENKEFNSLAVIKSDNDARRVYINVNCGQKRDYFSSILFNLREINKSFENLKAIEKIPLPDNPEITVMYSHLIYLEEIGEDKFRPEGSKKEYSVKDLLGTINIKKTEQELLEEILVILKKKNDEDVLDQIVSVLKELARNQAEESDNEETLSEKLNKTIMLKPNIMGCGVDFNEAINIAINQYFKRRRKNK